MKKTLRLIVLCFAVLLALSFTHGAQGVEPASVTIAGDLQSELGCPGDWQPDCATTHLTFDANDAVWQGTFTIPAGNWQYKAALDDSWNENYGANAIQNGANIEAAKVVGARIAARLIEQGIKAVVFDRNGYVYHGRVKALADSAREAGLQF